MGSQPNQQKAHKGWLSRWTRKQWSRHWFVLKNGSLTYYRGPAAELCSFLDGVLDLSLIKHIEVPQQEEQAASVHHHLHSQNHHYNQHQSQQILFTSHHHMPSQPAQQNSNHHHHHHHQQQQQHLASNQQLEQRFNFTLKMWNGECHLLSASSAAERQLWLAAINSCNNFDDDTASSDSSSSSQSSNISTKSTDVGTSSTCATSTNACSATPTTGGGLAKSAAKVQAAVAAGQTTVAAATTKPTQQQYFANRQQNAYQVQQQQQREAEISLEHLALKLKSVVRKRRDETPIELEEQRQPAQLLTRHDGHQSAAGIGNHEQQQQNASGQKSCMSEAEMSAHKRRLMCLRTDSTDDLMLADEEEEEDEDQEAETEAKAGGTSQDLIEGPSPPVESDEDHEAGEEELEEDDYADEDEKLEEQASPVAAQEEKVSGAETRPKKRVTFDLSNQAMGAESLTPSSSLSSSSGESDEDETSSSCGTSATISSATSEDEDEDEVEREDEDANKESQTSPTSESLKSTVNSTMEAKQQSSQTSLKQVSLEQVRRLELREQLKYSRQKEMDEDEDSTCELVRRMIERRKLRLANKEGAQVTIESEQRQPTTNSVCDTSATSPSAMETGENDDDDDDDQELELEANELKLKEEQRRREQELRLREHELELRLKSAEFNSGLLERRLRDSYLGYSQLESSYKQLQMELIKCQEVQSANLSQMQRKIDELTSELKSNELKLLEAREKLLKYEEHLAKWQLINSVNNNNNNNNISTQANPNSCKSTSQQQQQQHSWLTKNYSNCLSVLNAKHKIYELREREQHHHHQHQQQQQQQVSSTTTSGGGSGGQLPHVPLVLMPHHHLSKQTLALNQQQLSLKLLNQSKQIQRKLNELELKVDKIQSGAGGSRRQPEDESHMKDGNHNHLIGLQQRQNLSHLGRPLASGSCEAAAAE